MTTDDEVEWVKEQIEETGSFEKAEEKAKELIKEGKEILEEIELEGKQTLIDITDFLVERKF